MKTNTNNTPTFTIRPFQPTDADYKAIVDINNQAWPNQPSTVERYKHQDSIRTPNTFQRFVGEIKSEKTKQIVASCSISHKNYFRLLIDKNFENQGLHKPLYEHLVKTLANNNPSELETGTPENPLLIEFLLQKGFQETKRYQICDLDVPSFDFAPFRGYSEELTASGIAIVTIKDLQASDPNWLQKIYDLENTIQKSRPSKSNFIPPTLEEYAKYFERPNFRNDAWFIAVDGKDYVGTCSMSPDLFHKDLLIVGFTGTLPSYRRRNIGTTLKLKTIAFAQAYGAKTIKTSNNENNAIMYNLNLKLGFKPMAAWLCFKKVL